MSEAGFMSQSHGDEFIFGQFSITSHAHLWNACCFSFRQKQVQCPTRGKAADEVEILL